MSSRGERARKVVGGVQNGARAKGPVVDSWRNSAIPIDPLPRSLLHHPPDLSRHGPALCLSSILLAF